MTRKLVTIRTISALNPIPGADAIEVATVDGWKVVVKKGEYEVGQQVLYFEIDSVLPAGVPQFEFLMARGRKEHYTEDGTYVDGHRLRTIKLRGQVSQGLVIPIPENWEIFHDVSDEVTYVETFMEGDAFDINADFSSFFGVKKYEMKMNAQMAGQARGAYPHWMPKTDQERIQNCYLDVEPLLLDLWVIEEKVEGSSMTVYITPGCVGVTSRNLDLKLDQVGNTFVDTARRSGLFDALADFSSTSGIEQIAIRGELVGPGIQNNIYGLTDFRYYIYDVYIPENLAYDPNGYLNPLERERFFEGVIQNHPLIDRNIVHAVPVIDVHSLMEMDVDYLVAKADGKSVINENTNREGLVFKLNTDGNVSFKCISNLYLLKEK